MPPSALEENHRAAADAHFGESASGAMQIPAPPKFTDKYEERKYLKHRLALAFRVFGAQGYMDSGGVAGHITVRDPVDPTSLWVNPFGLHFSLITDDDLILVSKDGEIIDGGRIRLLNRAAYAIHSAIHEARPDVICAAHAHTIAGRAFCTGGRSLDITTQDSCVFYKDLVLYKNFDGVVLDSQEGHSIAQALGPRKAALLANHGLLTVGPSIEATVFWFASLDKCCESQLMAEAAVPATGIPIISIGEQEAFTTYKTIGSSRSGYFSGLTFFQMAEREFGESTWFGQGLKPWNKN